ncbi:4,5-dihydroxyphthalate decarboxylase [Jatrophihabitans sp. YIM 134969]
MTTRTLTMATGPYDTTRALFDGSVHVEGVDVTMRSAATLPDIFRAMMRGREFDVAELGWTWYLREFGPDTPYLALPVFPNRVFRHSCVFVNRNAGIEGPADLVGKTIGEWGMYGQDSGVWAKGVLSDDFGFDPAANRWVIGGLDAPAEPFDVVPQLRPPGIEITDVTDRALAHLLEDGEIDALVTANVPQIVLDGSARDITRLFPDFVPVEADWYRRTGVFPMMHPVVMRKDLLADTGLVRAVYDAFVAAKDVAMQRQAYARRLFGATMMLPWADALLDRNAEVFTGDWWPYGVEANRRTVEMFLRFHHAQGLSDRRLEVDEVFVPSLLDA